MKKEEKEELCGRMAALLHTVRRQLKLTQQELGEICGYSRIRVSNIETGKEMLSWHQFMSIAPLCLVNEKIRHTLEDEGVFTPEFYSYIS